MYSGGVARSPWFKCLRRVRTLMFDEPEGAALPSPRYGR
jgi:hypothetical protein